MGLVEAGRIQLVAEGPAGSFVPGTRFTRIDEPYPMSEVVRTLTPALHRVAARSSPSRTRCCGRTSADLDITSAAYLPLIAQARPIGAIGLLYSDTDGFTAEERNVLVALGSSIAQSLQRAMLYEQEHDLAAGPPAGHAAAPHPRACPAPRSPSATARRPARAGTSAATGTT